MSDRLYRVGFASCARIAYQDDFDNQPPCKLDAADFSQPVWGQIAGQHALQKLDAMLLLGDQVYSDYGARHDRGGGRPKKWPTKLFHDLMYEMYRAQYTDVAAFNALFQALKTKQTKIGVIWDDHDFGYNNGSGLEPAFKKNKESTKELIKQFVHALDNMPGQYPVKPTLTGVTPTTGIERITNPITLGADVEIIMLDSRYYRSARRGYGDELLGKPQWDALEAKLMSWNDPNKLLIICLGSPYSINTGGSNQSWAQVTYTGADHPFAHFERFTELARQKKIIFLSGDIHSNAFKDHNGFCEAISSGAHLPDDRNNPRFGLLDIYANKVDVKLYKSNAVEISKTINRATGSVL